MRNLFIGAALAVAFTAGTAATAPANPTPEQAAANAVQPGFVGMKQIGAWRLGCSRSAPAPMTMGKATPPVQTNVIQKGGQKMLNVQVFIPPRPCKVVDVLKQADKPGRQTAAWFLLRGPYGVLGMMFRAPVELFPGDTINPSALIAKSRGDTFQGEEFVTLKYDGAALKGPLIVCDSVACVAGIKIRHEDEPKVLAAKHFALELPAFPHKQPVRMNLPASGLAEAIGAMRRMEK